MTFCARHARMSRVAVLTFMWLLQGMASFAVAEDANQAIVDVRQENGFSRLVFSFDRSPKISSQSVSTIFVLKFKQPVAIDLKTVPGKLPDIVTIARVDPDGTGVRFAMTQAFKVNVIPAGNYLIVDFLPKNWRGRLPGVPQDIVEKLAKQAERARLAAAERARQEALLTDPLLVSVHHAKQPSFNRISFNWNRFVTAQFTRKGNQILVLFAGRAVPDLAHLRLDRPPNLKRIFHKLGKKSLQITMEVKKGTKIRAFREGKNYIIDLVGSNPDTTSSIEKKLHAATKAEATTPATGRGEEISLPDAGVRPADANRGSARPTQRADAPSLQRPEQKVQRQPVQLQGKAESGPQYSKNLPKQSKPAERAIAFKGKVELSGKREKNAGVQKQPDKPKKPVKKQLAGSTILPPKVTNTAPRPSKNRHVSNKVEVMRNENSVQLRFPFEKSKVPAAIFQRNENLWVLIDSPKKIDLSGLKAALGGIVNNVLHEKMDNSQLFQFKLSGPWLSSVSQHNANWNISIGDLVTGSARKIRLQKQRGAAGNEEVLILSGKKGRLHQIKDVHSGDDLLVITSPGPARNIKKLYDHVEFQLFKTIHGVVVRPLSDKLSISKQPKGIVIGVGGGLRYSGKKQARSLVRKKPRNKKRLAARKLLFRDKHNGDISKFIQRTLVLEREVASRRGRARRDFRLELARHWLSRGLAPEGFGMLEVAASENVELIKNPVFRLMRGMANVMLHRYKLAKKDLGSSDLTDNAHASLWRALAAYRQKKFARALAEFKRGEVAIKAYLPRQQAVFRLAAADAAIEQRDPISAGAELDGLPTYEILPVQTAMARFLEGRLLELQNRPRQAMRLYADATRANIPPVTARAVFHLTDLRLRMGDIKSAVGIDILQRLSIVWRGDDVELQVLHRLADLHLEQGRYGEAFSLMETAVKTYPEAPMALALQDRMKEQFQELFLRDKVDNLPPIKALALFYDHKYLTPPGRLGDEMIRRLADRLIDVDLLDKAASLLEHQVTRRLKGAGRAQVAIRLALVHLLQHQPKKALKTIFTTRQPGLPAQVREARRLLEARAYAEMGHSGQALELLNADDSVQAGEIKSLALWKAQKWTLAGEQYEKLLAAKGRDGTELASKERVQILRAAISYTLGGDLLGLERLREKYGVEMASGVDAEAFAMITDPMKSNARAVGRMAREIADIDTLEAFIKAFRQRLVRSPGPQTTSAVK